MTCPVGDKVMIYIKSVICANEQQQAVGSDRWRSPPYSQQQRRVWTDSPLFNKAASAAYTHKQQQYNHLILCALSHVHHMNNTSTDRCIPRARATSAAPPSVDP